MMNVKPAEEENDAEVRRVDQDNINKFARLNARLHEVRDEKELVKVRNEIFSFWQAIKRKVIAKNAIRLFIDFIIFY